MASAEAKQTLATLRDLRFVRSPSVRIGALVDATEFVESHPDEPLPVLKAILQLVAPTARRYTDRCVSPSVAKMECT